MEKNVGKIDRIIRFILGIVIVYFAFTLDNNTLKFVLLLLGLISITESLIGYCGLYKLFNINTLGGK
ncbi:MAG: DUF2892 domain-containing protein [Nanoarchaeota archaeon]